MTSALTLLLCCQLAGEAAARLLGVPLPGPVLGMLLLFVLMLWRAQLLERVRGPALTILQHLSLLFVPAGVGLMRHFGRLRSEALPIFAAIIVSTLATIAVTGFVFQLAARALDKESR
jgi:holin-like protein